MSSCQCPSWPLSWQPEMLVRYGFIHTSKPPLLQPRGGSREAVLIVVSLGQSPSRVWLFATPWTAAGQASLSLAISQSLSTFTSIGSVMPSGHPILWHPLLFLLSILPSKNFSSESDLFTSGGQSTGASAAVSLLREPCPSCINIIIILSY